MSTSQQVDVHASFALALECGWSVARSLQLLASVTPCSDGPAAWNYDLTMPFVLLCFCYCGSTSLFNVLHFSTTSKCIFF